MELKDQVPGLDSTPLVRVKRDHSIRGRIIKMTTYGKGRENYVMLENGQVYKATEVELIGNGS